MKSICILLLQVTFCLTVFGQVGTEYPKSLANIEDFKQLIPFVEEARAKRLISLDEFNQLAQEDNTIILDSRSKERYQSKHIKGAINLPFTEFTQNNLEAIIPDKNTRILIYCNNNFKGDIINFATKMYLPKSEKGKALTLALNIPTFINLYGYGYKNIYELDELVNIFDERIVFEGIHLPGNAVIFTRTTK